MVRKSAASVTERISSILASEVEALLLEEARFSPSGGQARESDDLKKEKRIKSINARFLVIAASPRRPSEGGGGAVNALTYLRRSLSLFF